MYNYCLLDSARMLENMDVAKHLCADHICLYYGKSEQDLIIVAPYLFFCEAGSNFSGWLRKEGFGNSWGVHFNSQAEKPELYKHFRKFLLVQDEKGTELYFRFYDPRVLRIFLPTCDEWQLKQFFGPVNHFMIEDEDPDQMLIFSLKEGKLHTQVKPS